MLNERAESLDLKKTRNKKRLDIKKGKNLDILT